jgi:hypothetical protein
MIFGNSMTACTTVATMSAEQSSLSTTSITLASSFSSAGIVAATYNDTFSFQCPVLFASFSTATTVYLVQKMGFASATAILTTGFIQAVKLP